MSSTSTIISALDQAIENNGMLTYRCDPATVKSRYGAIKMMSKFGWGSTAFFPTILFNGSTQKRRVTTALKSMVTPNKYSITIDAYQMFGISNSESKLDDLKEIRAFFQMYHSILEEDVMAHIQINTAPSPDCFKIKLAFDDKFCPSESTKVNLQARVDEFVNSSQSTKSWLSFVALCLRKYINRKSWISIPPKSTVGQRAEWKMIDTQYPDFFDDEESVVIANIK